MSLIDNTSLWPELAVFLQHGIIRQIDFQSSKFLSGKSSSNSDAVAWLTALLSRDLGRGHSCIKLVNDKKEFDTNQLAFGMNISEFVGLEIKLQAIDWLSVLKNSDVIGKSGEEKPLIFDGERLYFHRYWHYEVNLMNHLSHFGSPIEFGSGEIKKTVLGS